MTDADSRKAFEDHFRPKHHPAYFVLHSNGTYVFELMRMRWEAWQARGEYEAKHDERYCQMMEAAESYFRLLREAGPTAAGVDAAEQRLNELAAPFSDDPAFQALLKLERETQSNKEAT